MADIMLRCFIWSSYLGAKYSYYSGAPRLRVLTLGASVLVMPDLRLYIKTKMAAIRAAILFLHCMSFPLTIYPIVHTFTKFEQNRTSCSRAIPKIRF